MKYPERISRRGASGRPYHTAIATTFSIDFAAYEEIMLPQLMAAGATNLLVIGDARMASMSLSDGSQLPVQLGREYELYSPAIADGVFHPKILLQIGRGGGRLFVGSANITAAGLVGNAEAIIELECRDDASPEREVIRAAWRYLSGLVAADAGAASDAIKWAEERAVWLLGSEPEPVQHFDDGSAIAFLANDDGPSIGARFAEYVGGEAVDRLIAISPYWDDRLGALERLVATLAPSSVSVMLDLEQHEFPLDARRPVGVELRPLPPALHGRFAHAKVLVASTPTHDHALVGSANCTVAALGHNTAPGINAEACIYRMLPRDEAIEALGLAICLQTNPLDPSEIKPREPAPPIPLNETSRQSPGRFEIDGNILTWSPPLGLQGAGVLRLLDGRTAELDVLDFDGPAQSFEIPMEQAERISFVIVMQDEFVSYPAHVTHRSLLRRRRREIASGAVAKAIAAFDSSSDFDLWMHQAFDELARADLADRAHGPTLAARTHRAENPKREEGPHQLTYEEFMETRSPDHRERGRRDSTLAGTHSDSIRTFLNMLVGRQANRAAEEGPDQGDDGWMDLGDEGEDRHLDAETRRLEAEANAQSKGAEGQSEKPNGKPVDPRQFERMVRAYTSNITSGSEALGSADVLRLRFWLMMLLYKARHPGSPNGLPTDAEEHGWPRMAVRIMAAFFCGRRPPISRLMISREYTEMPADFLECWATVLWTLDAIEASLIGSNRCRQFLDYVRKLRAEVLKILGLKSSELLSDTVVGLRTALDTTIGARLGFLANAA